MRERSRATVCKNLTAVNQWLTEEAVADALRAEFGNVLRASQRVGCTRANIYDRIQRSPKLKKLQSELLQEEIDQHEGTLRKMAIEKEVPVAVLAFLNAKARDRG